MNCLLEKTNKSGPQPPSNNTNQPNATNTSTPKLNPNSPGYAPTKDAVSYKKKTHPTQKLNYKSDIQITKKYIQ